MGWAFRYFLFIALCLSSFTVFSKEEGAYIARNFNQNEYGGGNKVYAMVTTPDGLVYVGDKNSIIEYDGEEWNKIPTHFPIHSLALDKQNTVFVAGGEGIGKLEKDSINGIVYNSLNYLVDGQRNSNAYKNSEVFRLNDEILFVAENKLIIYSQTRIRIIENSFPYTKAQRVNNSLYLYASKSGLYKYADGEVLPVLLGDKFQYRGIGGFIESDEGLIIFENSKAFLLKDEALIEYQSALSKEIENVIIEGVEQVSPNTYALKTFYNGLILVRSDLQVSKVINQNSKLINNTVFDVKKDSQGNLWVATSNGISVFRQNIPFSIYNTRSGIGTGYAAIKINGQIYLGTSQGLWRKNQSLNGDELFESIYKGHLFGLSEVNNTLYFGHPTGLYSFSEKGIKPLVQRMSSGVLKQIPREPNTYLCSSNGGLLRFTAEGASKTLSYDGFLPGNNSVIHNFEIDTLNNIWVEYAKGVYHFNLETPGKHQNYTRIGRENRIKRVIKLHEQVFFLADSGVYAYNEANNSFYLADAFRHITKQYGVASKIVVDNLAKIWYFSADKLILCRWEEDGLKRQTQNNFEYINGAYPTAFENVYSLNDSTALIGSEQGFYHYRQGHFTQGTYSSVIIRELRLTSKDGLSRNIWGRESIDSMAYNLEIEELIPNAENSIAFEFAAGASNYKKVYYQTFLKGYNSKWTDWSRDSQKEYTNLAPGKYTFVVRALNEFDEFSKIAICTFEVDKPWTLSTSAKVAYSLGFVLFVLVGLFIIRDYGHRERRKALEKEKEERTKEEQVALAKKLVKEKNVALSKNEKLLTDNMHKSKELANLTLNLIQKNQALIDFREELNRIKVLSEKNKIVTADIKSLLRRINNDVESDTNWEAFGNYFDTVHEKFFEKLKKKYPDLSPKDLRLCAYLRMNLSTKEISPLMNISVRGVEIGRYRLRKKLNLDRNVNLSGFFNKL